MDGGFYLGRAKAQGSAVLRFDRGLSLASIAPGVERIHPL
jgi:hypothetical protein